MILVISIWTGTLRLDWVTGPSHRVPQGHEEWEHSTLGRGYTIMKEHVNSWFEVT